MKRLINVRWPLFAFVGLIAGIWCAYNMLYGRIVYTIILFSLLAVLLVAIGIFAKRFSLPVIFIAICVGCGFLLFDNQFNAIQQREVIVSEGTLWGRVTDLNNIGELSDTAIYLDECTFVEYSGESIPIEGKVCVYITNTHARYHVGDYASVYGTLRSRYVLKTFVNTSAVRNEVYYELSNVDSERMFFRKGDMCFDEKCRDYIYDSFSQYMPDSYGTAFALITGDKSAMEEDDTEAFRRAGIIHVLAVSGLHVGFIVSIFGFALSKLKLHPLLELVIVAIPLVFYAYICGFPPSVVRAIIMTCCVYIVKAVFGKVDLITSLSLAGIVILTIQPLYLFDAGFILSFLSVYGIATVYITINRWLSKFNLPKFVSGLIDSFAVSFGATVSTFCGVAYFYGEVSVMGLLFNVVAIPVVTVAFVLSMIGLLPFIQYLLVVPNYILYGLTFVARWVSSLSFATVVVGSFGVAAVVMVLWQFVFGEFVNVKGKAKIVAHVCLAVIFAVTTAISFIPTPMPKEIVVYESYYPCVIAGNGTGSAVVVCDCNNEYVTNNVVNYLKSKKIDEYVIFTGDTFKTTYEGIVPFLQYKKPEKVYTFNYASDSLRQALKKYDMKPIVVPPVSSEIDYKNFTFKYVCYGEISGMTLKVDDISIAMLYDVQYQPEVLPYMGKTDAYVTQGDADCVLKYDPDKPVFAYYHSSAEDVYGQNKFGNFTIKKKDGTITVYFSEVGD